MKRYDLLIRAFSRLRSSGLDVELVIAGDGPERESLERLCSELQITDRVRFLGDVEDLQPVYTNLDVFALTSDTEGLPMALLEAMSYGLAVTSTDVGAIPSLFADDEELSISKKGCETSIERQLQRLLADEGLRKRLGENARQTVIEHYSVESSLRQHERIYALAAGQV